MDEGRLDDILGSEPDSRRSFIKKLAVTTAFATPVVTSFTMSGLSMAGASNGSNLSWRGGNVTPK